MKVEPKRSAIVAIHLQGDVVTPAGAFGGFFAEMVASTGVLPRSATVLEAAREAGATVAYTRVAFDESHTGLIVNNALFDVIQQGGSCVLGTPGATIVDDVAPHDGDLVITHRRVGGAFDSSLVGDLRDRGVETVFIFGVATNLSVEATARQLSEEGFNVQVVADCCTAADQATHDASIGSLGLVTAGITDSASVIQALSGVTA